MVKGAEGIRLSKPNDMHAERSGYRSRRRTTLSKVLRGVGAGSVLALTAWHVFASFLWIFPPSPLRQLVPGDALSSYMLPMFGQSWSVFAPEPINGDYHFNVRAVVDSGDEQVVTGWVSATEVELSMVQYNLFPPRAGVQAEELASSFKGSWGDLSERQREQTLQDFTSSGWVVMLRESLSSGGQDQSSVEEYLREEKRATAYATQVAKAIWGDDVVKVQFRVSRQNVVPFHKRNDPLAERPEPSIALPGWRGLQIEDGQDEQQFAKVFKAQYDKLQESR